MPKKAPGQSGEEIVRGIAAYHGVSLERAAAMLVSGIRKGSNRIAWGRRLGQKPQERN